MAPYNSTLFITSETDSENEPEITCDEQSKRNEINLLIQKQIEDDLLTHDFSEPHVTREELQEILGMKIKNVTHYQRALVHKSIHKAIKKYNGSKPIQEYLRQHNERLEFLGDSVLGLIIANYLFHKYPDNDEGFLTRVKTKLVNGVQLSKLARQINLGKYILMSNHVQNIKGRNSQKILEDAFEAFLAAIFKDLGFDAVDSFVSGIIDTLDFTEILFEDNYKDTLLKYSQRTFFCTPEYNLLGTDGPPHNRLFHVAVVISGKTYSSGWGKSKKQAEQVAADQTLKNFN